MRSTILVLLLSLSASFPALAGRWLTIADGSTRAVHLDTAGIQREGAQTRAWVREVYTQEQRSDQAGVLYYSTNTLTNYDCVQRTSAPLFRVFYGSDAMELRRIKLDAVEVPALVLPGSVNEQLLNKACEVAEKQASDRKPKAQQEAQAKPPAPPPGNAATPVGAPAGQDKAEAAKPAEKAAEGKAGEAQSAQAKDAEAKPADKPAEAGAGAKDEAKKDVHAAAPAKPAEKNAATHVASDGHGKPASAPSPAPKPVSMPVIGGSTHGGPVQLPSIASARARAHGQALRVNAPTSRQARVKSKAEPQPEVKEDQTPHKEVHWGYAGPGAPDNWGKINPDYALCEAGKRQSPIDIREGARLDLEPIRFDYRPTPLRIVDNGHTIQVNYGEGSYITVAGERFELKQFHFHKPAEERIDGRWFDMVAHLVHKSMDGRLAVVAVLFEMRDQPNPFLRGVWPHLPLEPGREVMMREVMIDASQLLPETRTYFTYMGSLTTPPCTEGVRWIVLKTPVEVSFDQVAVFSKLYSMNARPIQPSHGRLIKESM